MANLCARKGPLIESVVEEVGMPEGQNANPLVSAAACSERELDLQRSACLEEVWRSCDNNSVEHALDPRYSLSQRPYQWNSSRQTLASFRKLVGSPAISGPVELPRHLLVELVEAGMGHTYTQPFLTNGNIFPLKKKKKNTKMALETKMVLETQKPEIWWVTINMHFGQPGKQPTPSRHNARQWAT